MLSHSLLHLYQKKLKKPKNSFSCDFFVGIWIRFDRLMNPNGSPTKFISKMVPEFRIICYFIKFYNALTTFENTSL